MEECPLVRRQAADAIALRLRDHAVDLLDVHRMQSGAWNRLPLRNLLIAAAQPPTAPAVCRRVQLPLVRAPRRPKVDPTQVQKRADVAAKVSKVRHSAAEAA